VNSQFAFDVQAHKQNAANNQDSASERA